ncbi:hypothetical protein VB780_15605 [Leptolyngbya sp. CCNP1308]|uniref:hypothetical protein n=1 Tax=Leptolyngbya sp. CCNP1308 TaxID=3110255 RepID=UPI002B1F0EDE|nr:hypothetical protein [Leptolyngbya sp. CCNP1308]MEA5450006.1 hypothetical protein [Leptolyngbya sp. CCNP1308]
MNRLTKSLLGLAVVGTAVLGATSATAQIFEIGDQAEFDLRDNRNPELRPNLSVDDGQLNIQLEEQPRPETRIRFDEGRVEFRQERPEPRERLNLTVPLEEDE